MNDERFERVIAIVLAAGVVVSAALVATGFIGSFFVGWTGSLTGAVATGTATTDFSALASRLIALQPLAIAQLGLIVLVATPVARVLATAVGFYREHDRLYVVLSVIVLVLLAVSFVLLR